MSGRSPNDLAEEIDVLVAGRGRRWLWSQARAVGHKLGAEMKPA